MRELGIVSVLLGLLVGVSYLATFPWQEVMTWGWWTIGAGMALGVPTGFIYHVMLYRALVRRDALPPRWYWSPIRLNGSLLDDERGTVLPWMYAGGVGFLFVTLGIVLVGIGLLSAWSALAQGDV